eukprot:g17318.t1
MGWCHRVLSSERTRGGLTRVDPELVAASTSTSAPSSSAGCPATGRDSGSGTSSAIGGSGDAAKDKERAELARTAVYPDQIKQIAIEILVHFGVNLQKRLRNSVIRVLIDRFRVAMRKAIAEAGAAATGFVAAVRLTAGCGAEDGDADGAPLPGTGQQTLELFSAANANEDRADEDKVTLEINAHAVLSRANSKARGLVQNLDMIEAAAGGSGCKRTASGSASSSKAAATTKKSKIGVRGAWATSKPAQRGKKPSSEQQSRGRKFAVPAKRHNFLRNSNSANGARRKASAPSAGTHQAAALLLGKVSQALDNRVKELYKGAAATAAAARRALVTDSEGVIEAYTRPADLPLELRERIVKQESNARRRKTLRYRPAGASLSRGGGGAAAGPPTLAGTMLRGLSLWRQLTDGFKPVVENKLAFVVDAASASDGRAERRARNNYAHVKVAPYRALRPDEPEMKYWQTHLFAEVVVRQILRAVDAIAELSDRFSALRWEDAKGLSRYTSSELGTSGFELFGDELVYLRENKTFADENKIGSRRMEPGQRAKAPTSAWRKPWNRPQSETNERPLYKDPHGRYNTKKATKKAGACSPICGRPDGRQDRQKGADRGECDACDGDQGTRGACCRRNESSDPPECRLPGIHWQYPKADYAQCVLLPGRMSPRKLAKEKVYAQEQASSQLGGHHEVAQFVDPIGAVMFAGYGPGGVFFPSVGGKRAERQNRFRGKPAHRDEEMQQSHQMHAEEVAALYEPVEYDDTPVEHGYEQIDCNPARFGVTESQWSAYKLKEAAAALASSTSSSAGGGSASSRVSAGSSTSTPPSLLSLQTPVPPPWASATGELTPYNNAWNHKKEKKGYEKMEDFELYSSSTVGGTEFTFPEQTAACLGVRGAHLLTKSEELLNFLRYQLFTAYVEVPMRKEFDTLRKISSHPEPKEYLLQIAVRKSQMAMQHYEDAKSDGDEDQMAKAKKDLETAFIPPSIAGGMLEALMPSPYALFSVDNTSHEDREIIFGNTYNVVMQKLINVTTQSRDKDGAQDRAERERRRRSRSQTQSKDGSTTTLYKLEPHHEPLFRDRIALKSLPLFGVASLSDEGQGTRKSKKHQTQVAGAQAEEQGPLRHQRLAHSSDLKREINEWKEEIFQNMVMPSLLSAGTVLTKTLVDRILFHILEQFRKLNVFSIAAGAGGAGDINARLLYQVTKFLLDRITAGDVVLSRQQLYQIVVALSHSSEALGKDNGETYERLASNAFAEQDADLEDLAFRGVIPPSWGVVPVSGSSSAGTTAGRASPLERHNFLFRERKPHGPGWYEDLEEDLRAAKEEFGKAKAQGVRRGTLHFS